MGIIGWIVLGLLAGIIAKAIFPGGESLGLILTTLLGIGGALLGGLLASLVGLGDPIDDVLRSSRPGSAAIVGALVILWIASKLGIGRGHRSRLADRGASGRPDAQSGAPARPRRRRRTQTPGRGKTWSSSTSSAEPTPSSTPSTRPRCIPHTTAGLSRARSAKGHRCMLTSSPSRRGSKPRSARTRTSSRDGALGRLRGGGPVGRAPAPRATRRLGVGLGAWAARNHRDERLGEGAVLVRRRRARRPGPLPDATRAAGRLAVLGTRGDDAGVLEDSEVPAHGVRVEPDAPSELARVERPDRLLEGGDELRAAGIGESAVKGGRVCHGRSGAGAAGLRGPRHR